MTLKPTNNQCDILVQYLLGEEGDLNKVPFWASLSKDYQSKLNRTIKQYDSNDQTEGLTGGFSDWIKISNHFVEHKSKTLKSGSYRALRAPLKSVLNYGLEMSLIDEIEIKEALSLLHNSNGLKASEIAHADKSSSAKKSKSIKPEEIYSLRSYSKLSSDSASFVVDWLEFNILTNCRPNELQEATLILSKSNEFKCACLRVRNTIKNNKSKDALNADSSLSHRLIPLENCSFHDLTFIDNFLTQYSLKVRTSSYETIFQSSRSLLAKISEKVLNRKVSLSLGRTQWAANAKSTDIDKSEIANSMGHANEEQATKSYGRKNQGWQKVQKRDQEERDES